MERLLSLDEVCDLLGLGPDHVRRAVRRGDLVASKIGGRLRFRAGDVDAYVDAQRVEPAVPTLEAPRGVASIPPLVPRTRKPASFRDRAARMRDRDAA